MSEQKKRKPRTSPEDWEREILMLRKRFGYMRAKPPHGLGKEPLDRQLKRLEQLETRLAEHKASPEYAGSAMQKREAEAKARERKLTEEYEAAKRAALGDIAEETATPVEVVEADLAEGDDDGES